MPVAGSQATTQITTDLLAGSSYGTIRKVYDYVAGKAKTHEAETHKPTKPPYHILLYSARRVAHPSCLGSQIRDMLCLLASLERQRRRLVKTLEKIEKTGQIHQLDRTERTAAQTFLKEAPSVFGDFRWIVNNLAHMDIHHTGVQDSFKMIVKTPNYQPRLNHQLRLYFALYLGQEQPAAEDEYTSACRYLFYETPYDGESASAGQQSVELVCDFAAFCDDPEGYVDRLSDPPAHITPETCFPPPLDVVDVSAFIGDHYLDKIERIIQIFPIPS
ncbi:hypothetical protein EIP91_001255 [Steccherinum ochraceum]|uniref:Uncharacterized protein n=1 Tax=Steccherinum ochraceum TaxID=92696 RepID=A0A4R0RV09_9APHY|nr:hypothetical protein EIP91_001255 [Steccherinum ochraceum]